MTLRITSDAEPLLATFLTRKLDEAYGAIQRGQWSREHLRGWWANRALNLCLAAQQLAPNPQPLDDDLLCGVIAYLEDQAEFSAGREAWARETQNQHAIDHWAPQAFAFREAATTLENRLAAQTRRAA